MSVSPFTLAGGFPYNPQPFGYYTAIPAQVVQPQAALALPAWAIPSYLGGGGTPQYAIPSYVQPTSSYPASAYGQPSAFANQAAAYPQQAPYGANYPSQSAGFPQQSAYTPSYPSSYPVGPSYSPQSGYTGGQAFPPQTTRPNIPVLFRPVIVQNQSNQLPLRNLGGLNAVMNAAALLNVQPGQQVY